MRSFRTAALLDWESAPYARVSHAEEDHLVPLFAAHAVVSEVVQGALLPMRAGDPFDVLADLTGVALGVLLWRLRR